MYEYWDAFKFKNDAPEMCCTGRIVKFPELHTPLTTLLSSDTILSKHFLSSIRKYNPCFQMTFYSAIEIAREIYMPTFKVK